MTEQRTIALVSCVKSKRSHPAPAQDLYTSALFRGMRRYAEANADQWYILSAKHGLLNPTIVINPYEMTLKKMGVAQRTEWSGRVADAIKAVAPKGSRLLILAGLPYRAGLENLLGDRYELVVPMAGLSFGPQLQWLKAHVT